MVIKNILGLALAPGWLRQTGAGGAKLFHLFDDGHFEGGTKRPTSV
jgi:hypothetical protein